MTCITARPGQQLQFVGVLNCKRNRHNVNVVAASMSDAPSNSINLEVLRHLQGVFRKADQDGSGQLDMDEFVEAFRGVG